MSDVGEAADARALAAAFQRMAARSPAADKALIAVVEGMYAISQRARNRPGAFTELRSRLAGLSDSHPDLNAYRLMLELRLAGKKAHAPALQQLDVALAECCEWTRVLVGASAAEELARREGASRGWEHIRALPWRSAVLKAELSDEDLESPGLHHALSVYLQLAAHMGAWREHDELSVWAGHRLAAQVGVRARVTLHRAEAAITRGDHEGAEKLLEELTDATDPEIRARVYIAQLQLYVCLGGDKRADAKRLRRQLRKLLRSREARVFASAERRRLQEQLALLMFLCGWYSPSKVRGRSLTALLHRALLARDLVSPERREQALRDVLSDTNVALRYARHKEPEHGLRLRLLWCRTVLDLLLEELYEECEALLSGTAESAAQLGIPSLTMQALDTRAIVRSRKTPMDFQGALLDSAAASRMAHRQIANWQTAAAERTAGSRGMISSLLPVVERIVEVAVEGALRLRRQPEATDSFRRFGAMLHGFAERTQVLALSQARRYRTDVTAARETFTPLFEGAPPELLDELQKSLAPHEGVLQYLLAGHYLLAFAYGRDFFAWHAAPLAGKGGSEEVVRELMHSLRAWTQGAAPHAPELTRLHEMLLPPELDEALSRADVRHLCIVPHGALYRVPFGRLAPPGGLLARRFSLSIHPTGRIACAATGSGRVLKRRLRLGHVIGPALMDRTSPVECAESEHRALERGLGKRVALAHITAVDSVRHGQAATLAALSSFELLHFTCHGIAGSEHTDAALQLGNEEPPHVRAHTLSSSSLQGCALVVLQACSTGWMDHTRLRPVQGLPQALLDAGAGTVVAPLAEVPEALTPLFSELFYRTLRFLPAERALRLTMGVLRRHGMTLLARDERARESLRAVGGSLDVLEYRCTGRRGVTLGSSFARLVGRAAFMVFMLQLHIMTFRLSLSPPTRGR